MKALVFLLLIGTAPAVWGAASPFAGAWDLVVTPKNGAPYPDWMDLADRDGKTILRIQPRSGGAKEIGEFKAEGTHLHLLFSKADARNPTKNPEVTWDLDVAGDKITGTISRAGTASAEVAGVRAPKLDRKPPQRWTDPEPLFNGKDLAGWEPMTPNNHWMAKDSELVNIAGGANLKTTRAFDDFKLHFEVNCPADGNSGVYLRGRYELQIEYQDVDASDRFHSIGSIYSFVGPSVMLPRTPGTWETFDVTLVGRRITIVRNGTKTVDNQEIPGPTGGALDSNEGEPGPFYIQGDHTGGLRYRNITIQTPRK